MLGDFHARRMDFRAIPFMVTIECKKSRTFKSSIQETWRGQSVTQVLIFSLFFCLLKE